MGFLGTDEGVRREIPPASCRGSKIMSGLQLQFQGFRKPLPVLCPSLEIRQERGKRTSNNQSLILWPSFPTIPKKHRGDLGADRQNTECAPLCLMPKCCPFVSCPLTSGGIEPVPLYLKPLHNYRTNLLGQHMIMSKGKTLGVCQSLTVPLSYTRLESNNDFTVCVYSVLCIFLR